METTLALVPDRDRQNVITALVVYTCLVFGLAASAVVFALGKGLAMWGHELPARAFGGFTGVLFAIMLVVTLVVFRRVAAGGSPAGRAAFGRWLLQGALLFALIGTIAAVLEALFLGAGVPALRPYFEPGLRGTIGATMTAALYGVALWIAYRWAKGLVDAR